MLWPYLKIWEWIFGRAVKAISSLGVRSPWHKSKISEKLGQSGRQNMLRPYLKIWEWECIFGRAVKAFSSLGVRSPCLHVCPPKMDFHKKTAWTLKAKAKKLHFFGSAIKVYVTIPTKVYHLSGSVTKNSICDPVLGSAIKDKERLLHAYFLFCKTSLICAL